MRFALLCGQARSVLRFRLDMLKEIKLRGHQVVVIGPCDDLPELGERLSLEGIDYVQLNFNRGGLNPFADFWLLIRLIIIFKKIRPDILFSYHIKPVVYGTLAAKIAGVKNRFAMITGLGFMFGRVGVIGEINYRIATLLYWLSCKFLNTIFMQNTDDQAVFLDAKICSVSKIALTAGSGVNLSRFSPGEKYPNKLTFLIVTRLLKDKGINEFFAAAKKFNEKYPNKAIFQVIGPPDVNPQSLSAEHAISLAKESGVDYLGEKKSEEIVNYLRQASVYVLPSYREGTPRSTLEAMACGLAVITTDAPGCRETVVEGVNGFLVPVKQSDELFLAMEKFYLNPSLVEKMGKEGLRIVHEKFDVNIVNEFILLKMGISHVS